MEPVHDSRLQDLIDWDRIMPMPRSAGGHDDQMQALFCGATVLGHWNECVYEGYVATAVRLPDGRFACYQDSYGSCSGCDAWEDASDEDVRKLCIDLANDARLFWTLAEMLAWLDAPPSHIISSVWATGLACAIRARIADGELDG